MGSSNKQNSQSDDALFQELMGEKKKSSSKSESKTGTSNTSQSSSKSTSKSSVDDDIFSELIGGGKSVSTAENNAEGTPTLPSGKKAPFDIKRYQQIQSQEQSNPPAEEVFTTNKNFASRRSVKKVTPEEKKEIENLNNFNAMTL